MCHGLFFREFEQFRAKVMSVLRVTSTQQEETDGNRKG